MVYLFLPPTGGLVLWERNLVGLDKLNIFDDELTVHLNLIGSFPTNGSCNLDPTVRGFLVEQGKSTLEGLVLLVGP